MCDNVDVLFLLHAALYPSCYNSWTSEQLSMRQLDIRMIIHTSVTISEESPPMLPTETPSCACAPQPALQSVIRMFIQMRYYYYCFHLTSILVFPTTARSFFGINRNGVSLSTTLTYLFRIFSPLMPILSSDYYIIA